MLELVDSVLELLIEHDAVREHDHAVEDALVVGVVQRREPVGEPSDGVALAASGGVLDEVVVSRALPACGVHEQAHRLKLMVAGEDHGLRLDLVAPLVPLLFDLQVNETGQDVEQTVALQHLFPQVGRAVAPSVRVGRIARRTGVSLVEGQELRRLAGQPGGHEHGVGVRSEVGQRAALELEDGLMRVAVPLVLPACVLGALAGERVLELQRRHRNAVQAQGNVERLLGARREMKLASEAQAVGGVAGLELGIQFVGRLEPGHAERAAVALESVPQGRKRTVLVHPLAQIAEDLLAGPIAMQPFQPGPLFRLGITDEGEDLSRENRAFAVEALAGDPHIAAVQQVGFDDRLEGGFAGPLHFTVALECVCLPLSRADHAPTAGAIQPVRWPALRHTRASLARLQAKPLGSSL